MATKTKINTNKVVKTTAKVVKTAKVEAKTPVVGVSPEVKAGKGRVITGTVKSDKMINTVVIEVTRLVAHPVYQKRMRKTNKFHAHNAMGAKIGNLVEITECKPISKTKFFTVTKIIS